jgi:hypothetical protein
MGLTVKVVYAEKFALAQTPFEKAVALNIRVLAYQRIEHFTCAVEDCNTILSLLPAERKIDRATIQGRLSHLYYLMDNYPKAEENLIEALKGEGYFSTFESKYLGMMLRRYFFKITELILQPECPQRLRSEVEDLLSREFPNITLVPDNTTYVELCHFFRTLSMHHLPEFRDKSQTTNKILQLAAFKNLSAEALNLIKGADKFDLDSRKKRRSEYYTSTQQRHFDFFRELPDKVVSRPATPLSELRI